MGLISHAQVSETTLASRMSVLSEESEMSDVTVNNESSVIETDKRAKAIAWLKAYSARALKDGDTARTHLSDLFKGLGESAIAEGKGKDAKLIGDAATIAGFRVGRVMPDADRAALVKEWQDDTRDGGKIGQTIISYLLGVAQSTVSADLRAGETTEANAPIGPDVRITEAQASLKKWLGKIDTPSQEVLDTVHAIERMCREFRTGKTSGRS